MLIQRTLMGNIQRHHQTLYTRDVSQFLDSYAHKVEGKKNVDTRLTKSMTELAGGEMCLPQRPHNQVGTARRGRRRRTECSKFEWNFTKICDDVWPDLVSAQELATDNVSHFFSCHVYVNFINMII